MLPAKHSVGLAALCVATVVLFVCLESEHPQHSDGAPPASPAAEHDRGFLHGQQRIIMNDPKHATRLLLSRLTLPKLPKRLMLPSGLSSDALLPLV